MSTDFGYKYIPIGGVLLFLLWSDKNYIVQFLSDWFSLGRSWYSKFYDWFWTAMIEVYYHLSQWMVVQRFVSIYPLGCEYLTWPPIYFSLFLGVWHYHQGKFYRILLLLLYVFSIILYCHFLESKYFFHILSFQDYIDIHNSFFFFFNKIYYNLITLLQFMSIPGKDEQITII